MGIARAWSVALVGITPHLVEVEVDVASGLPDFVLTALSDKVLNHAKHRVRSAVTNSKEAWPARKVTVALLPATVPKSGSRYDLSIALATIAAAGGLPAELLAEWVVLGELSLTGSVKPVTGILPAVLGAYESGRRRFIVPAANYAEACCAADVEVVAAGSLAQICEWLRGEAPRPAPPEDSPPLLPSTEPPDLADVVGQPAARRALEVAAAGGHHMLLTGPPGVGKTMLAERLPGLLPPLTEAQAREVTAIHSVAGALCPGQPLIVEPPFCAPHHSASTASIVGGGLGLAGPGAISRAHRGVLLLDEAPEFAARTLDALRQPLESGWVTLARSAGVVNYPCRFQLVLACNPCPCSVAGAAEGSTTCTCSSAQRRRYLARLSGPLLDRIDIRVRFEEVSRAVLDSTARGESTAEVRPRVLAARARAQTRLAGTPWSTNVEVPGPVLRRRWPVPRETLRPLQIRLDRGQLSTRGLDRVLKLSWTLADLAELPVPGVEQVHEATALHAGYDVTHLRAIA
jgi:magnesium chelatase family protein